MHSHHPIACENVFYVMPTNSFAPFQVLCKHLTYSHKIRTTILYRDTKNATGTSHGSLTEMDGVRLIQNTSGSDWRSCDCCCQGDPINILFVHALQALVLAIFNITITFCSRMKSLATPFVFIHLLRTTPLEIV